MKHRKLKHAPRVCSSDPRCATVFTACGGFLYDRQIHGSSHSPGVGFRECRLGETAPRVKRRLDCAGAADADGHVRPGSWHSLLSRLCAEAPVPGHPRSESLSGRAQPQCVRAGRKSPAGALPAALLLLLRPPRRAQSLLDCFVSTHGSECDVCQKEAVLSYQLTRKGKTPAQIRAAIIHGDWRAVDLNPYMTANP